MPSRETETPKCNELPAIGKKPTLTQEDKAKVARLERQIQGEFDGRYVELVLTYTSVDLLSKDSPKHSERCEVSTVEVDGQKIAVARLPGARQPLRKGPAARDVVTAHVELLKEIEAVKPSKQ